MLLLTFSEGEELWKRLAIGKACIWVSELVEVWVEQGNKWPWSLLWVVAQEPGDEVDRLPWSPVSEDFLPGEWLYLWEFVFGVVRVHRENLLPRGSTENLDDLYELVDTALTREDWLSKHELCDDTPDRPDIDVRAVLGVSKDQLWCTIVP